PRLGTLVISVTAWFRFCFLYEASAIAHGTVLSFSPSLISSGPRAAFSVSTFASVQGFRLAVAAWKSGAPDAGTWFVWYRSFASYSLRVLAQTFLYFLNVSVT